MADVQLARGRRTCRKRRGTCADGECFGETSAGDCSHIACLPLCGKLRAGGCIGREIAEDELNPIENELREIRRCEQSWRVPHGTVENAALAVALDPHRALLIIGANFPVAEIRFCGI